MLTLLAHPAVSRVLPGLVPGRRLHFAALAAAQGGDCAQAERLFEAAAAAYRREWAVEPMARLRVHQRMVRAQSLRGQEAEHMLEIVRALNKLDTLESLRAPYALGDAREVLSEWLADTGAAPLAAGASPEALAA